MPYETCIIRKNGERCHLAVSHRHMETGGARKYCVIVKDITEKKQAESELEQHREHLEQLVAKRTADLETAMRELEKESTEREWAETSFRALADNAGEAILIGGEDGSMLYVNVETCRLTGYTVEELMGMHDVEVIVPDDRERIADYTRRRLRGEAVPRPYLASLLTNDGREVPVEVVGARTLWRGQPATIGMMRDISEQRRTAAELVKSHEELRRLTRHLQEARDAERATIAREIHDELGQSLTALKLDLHWVDSKLDEGNVLHERVSSMIDIADGTIQTVKRLSAELKPALLEDEGLHAAIEWHLEQFTGRRNVVPSLSVSLNSEPPPQLRLAVFRVFQEALTNVLRHSGATAVQVALEEGAHGLRLKVEDNGQGFSGERPRASNSMGLIGMRERVHALGGTISIESQENKGTVVLAVFPLDGESALHDEKHS